MMAYNINIFISHSWKYSNNYETLSEWIFKNSWNINGIPINFLDFSVPKDHPIHNAPTDKILKDAIYNRIRQSDVIVIPARMYAGYSKWIGKEINGASEYNKPILAINLWGSERSSSIVIQSSQECVGWKKQSVVNGIWKLFLNNR